MANATEWTADQAPDQTGKVAIVTGANSGIGFVTVRELAKKGARIVNVSSLAHMSGYIDFENINAERKYAKWPAYGMSKLANLLFTYETARRLEANGAEAIAVAAHPGWTATNLPKTTNVGCGQFPVCAGGGHGGAASDSCVYGGGLEQRRVFRAEPVA
jgi:NAD(P)-dependent dehydrogenase (short-subunit alcohol dehydrogenase family)